MTSETKSMEAQEAKWKAENDARTLAEADVITKDKNRMEAAQKAAEEMAAEQEKEAEAMKKVSEGGIDYEK